MMNKFEKYNSSLDYTYVFGAFGTIELLMNKAQEAIAVLVDSSFVTNETFHKLQVLCEKNNVELIVDTSLVCKIKDKGNIFVIGVFHKFQTMLHKGNHVAVYGQKDVGVIGTIIRSLNGFECDCLALIDCPIDLYDEHLIRSTMGSYFKVNVETFNSLHSYQKAFPENKIYQFSTQGLDIHQLDTSSPFTLLFSDKKRLEEGICSIGFDKDIPLENIVNIILFQLYQRR